MIVVPGAGAADMQAGMRHRRKRGSAGNARSMAGELMGLSLFVMLLAFFIVMNAISRYEEEKLRPVMQSLDSAFTIGKTPSDSDLGSSMRVGGSETAAEERGALDRLKALFTAQIPGHDIVLNRHQGVMQVSVPWDEFETAVMGLGTMGFSGGKADGFGKNFLPMLVALVKTQEAGVPYRMDILLNIEENPALMQNRQPQKLAEAMERMAALATQIEAAGLPVKQMSIGVQKGRAGTAELLFRHYEPFNPAGTE